MLRISSESSLNGRRYATIFGGKVLHYDNGCQQSYHLMSFLDGIKAAVKNPLHFLSVNHHPCTSCSLSSDVPRISPDAITTPAAILASFYRCRFLRYKLRNGTIPVFSRPSDKSLLFSLLMTSINLEYTRTHHLEGRR